jgi:hypothetical protein
MQAAGYREIPVTWRGETVYALVDAEDYERLAQFNWHGVKGYATRIKQENRVRTRFSMHREILGLGPADKIEVDHINRKPLDNRRANLRLATRAENGRNLSPRKNAVSPYRGVLYCRRGGKWIARAYLAGHAYFLGRHALEVEAARVVNEFWVEHGYAAPNELPVPETSA